MAGMERVRLHGIRHRGGRRGARANSRPRRTAPYRAHPRRRRQSRSNRLAGPWMRGRRRLIAAAEIKARRRRDQSRTTGILPVPEHGLEGRGTKFVRRTKILLTSSTVVSEGFRDLVCGEIEAGSQLLRNARVPFFFQRRGKVGTCVPVPVSLVLVK